MRRSDDRVILEIVQLIAQIAVAAPSVFDELFSEPMQLIDRFGQADLRDDDFDPPARSAAGGNHTS